MHLQSRILPGNPADPQSPSLDLAAQEPCQHTPVHQPTQQSESHAIPANSAPISTDGQEFHDISERVQFVPPGHAYTKSLNPIWEHSSTPWRIDGQDASGALLLDFSPPWYIDEQNASGALSLGFSPPWHIDGQNASGADIGGQNAGAYTSLCH